MNAEVRNILLGLSVVLVLLAYSFSTWAKPAYYDEQLLNYRKTDFCAAVKKPPKRVAEGINGAHAADPKGGWEYEIEWFNRIVEKYAELKCGDA